MAHQSQPSSHQTSSINPPPASQVMPGFVLAVVIAWLGLLTSEWVGRYLLGFEKSPISGIMMAIVLGLIVSNAVKLPSWTQAGVRFSTKTILKLGIILLGIRLSLGDVVQIGALGVPLIIFCIVGALWMANWLGKRLDLPPRLTTLIAIGTSICGATAIVAAEPAIHADDEEVTYAVANITIFGLLAMFTYPLIAHLLFANAPVQAGLFLGTSIHETAQVAGSGLIYAEMYDAAAALDAATITKLVRNIFMVAIIPLMAFWYARQTTISGAVGADEQTHVSVARLFPLFILGFLLMAIVRTVGDATLQQNGMALGLWPSAAWADLTHQLRVIAEFLLAIAMAGVGLGTRLDKLRHLGLKPFIAGFVVAVTVALFSGLGIMILFNVLPVS